MAWVYNAGSMVRSGHPKKFLASPRLENEHGTLEPKNGALEDDFSFSVGRFFLKVPC